MSWKEQEERKKREAEERARQEAEKKAHVLQELKAEREGSSANSVELHAAKNQGESARYGGGGEVCFFLCFLSSFLGFRLPDHAAQTSWNKQDKVALHLSNWSLSNATKDVGRA